MGYYEIMNFICFVAKAKELPASRAQEIEEWSLFQAITGLNEAGRTSEAEALCEKVWLMLRWLMLQFFKYR